MASEKVLASKKEKVAKLADLLRNSKSGALVDYQGVTVEEDTKLRRDMRENNVNYFVEKNTMLRLAFKEAGIEGLDDVLNGATAIAVSADDETAPARILGKYAEKLGDDKFNLKAGFIGTDRLRSGRRYRSVQDPRQGDPARTAGRLSPGSSHQVRCYHQGCCGQEVGGRCSISTVTAA